MWGYLDEIFLGGYFLVILVIKYVYGKVVNILRCEYLISDKRYNSNDFIFLKKIKWLV